jgi:hypothetical protein
MNAFDLRKCTVGALTVLAMSFAAAAYAQKVADFTADQVTLDAAGKPLRQSKVYFSAGKMRMDDVMPQSGVNLIMIYRSDLKKNFMLNTDKKIYTEREMDENELSGAITSMAAVKNRKEKQLGEETVNGYPCVKKEIEAEIEVMGIKNISRSVVWQSPKFDLPLRTRTDSGQVTELRNIQEQKPAAALFEVPSGYNQVAGMMELLGDERAKGRRPATTGSKSREGGSAFPPQLPPGFKLPSQKP